MGFFNNKSGQENNSNFDSARLISLYNSKNYEDALAQCKIALQIQPSNYKIEKLKGKCLLNLNRHDEAFVSFQNVLKISIDEPGVQFNIFQCLFALNRKVPALLAFLNAVTEEDPDAQRLIQNHSWTSVITGLILDEIKDSKLSSQDKETLAIAINTLHKQFWAFIKYHLANSLFIEEIVNSLELIVPDWFLNNVDNFIALAYSEYKEDRRENAETISEFLVEFASEEESVIKLQDFLDQTPL